MNVKIINCNSNYSKITKLGVIIFTHLFYAVYIDNKCLTQT